MKKSILNLGNILDRKEQQLIIGSSLGVIPFNGCGMKNCNNGGIGCSALEDCIQTYCIGRIIYVCINPNGNEHK